MSTDLLLREAPPNSNMLAPTEALKGVPLTNEEIDNNFQLLNSNKISSDGSIAIKDLKIVENVGDLDGVVIRYNGINKLFLGDDNIDVVIPGNLNVLGQETSTLTVNSKSVTLGVGVAPDPDLITDYISAAGGGLQLGNDDGEGFVNFLCRVSTTGNSPQADYLSFRAFASNFVNINDIGTPVNLEAADFKILDSDFDTSNFKSLLQLYGNVDNIDSLLGTNGGTSAGITYNSINTIQNSTSLKAAVEALDATNIPAFKDAVGVSTPGAINYTSADSNLLLVNTDDLYQAINKINDAMRYVIHHVEYKSGSSSFVVYSSHLYRVQPDANVTIALDLPSTNRGIVAFRLEDSSSNRKIKIRGGSAPVENKSSTDYVVIDTALQTIQFIWDSATSRWRIM